MLVRKGALGTAHLVAGHVANARFLRASKGVASWQVRRGRLTRDRLSSMRFAHDPLEAMAGRVWMAHEAPPEETVAEAASYLEQYPGPPGQTGHCELDVDPLFELGVDGLKADIAARLDAAQGERAEAYASFLDALDGFSAMIAHAGTAVEEAGGDAKTAASCRRIAHEAPVSFLDALHLVWFATLGVMEGDQVGLVVPGHLDRTLARFYEADLARGEVTSEQALVCVENLYLLINEYIPDGLAMSVMVGGVDADGRDVTNELSYLCLQALRRTRLIYPTVGVCWHEGTPRDLVELAIDLISIGCPNPAFFGDATIQRGLRSLGVPADESCHYINSTCVEITPSRSSNVWVASPYFPVCQMLLDTIDAEVDSGESVTTFESFLTAFRERLGEAVATGAANENAARELRRKYGRKPLQSVFTRDCVGRGRDIDDGGGRYNWVECSFVGLANLVDSLQVLREEVFEEKRLRLAEVKAILEADFAGHERERRRWLEGHAKYGQDCAAVDGLFAEVVDFARAECAKHRIAPDDAPFVPGAFCWVMHEALGRQCGATPDGRRAGVPFADGCGPAQGRESCGPTAAILSTTSWEHSPMLGGLAYNMKFSRRFFDTPKGVEALRDLVLTFLRRGGFETQINVVDAETLKEARQHPDEHRDLVVRIGGYTDYFTRLSPEMQDEVILRTEFAQA